MEEFGFISCTRFSAPTVADSAVQEAAETLLGHIITDEEFKDLIQKTGDKMASYITSGSSSTSTSSESSTSSYTRDDIFHPQPKTSELIDNDLGFTLNNLVKTADDVIPLPESTNPTFQLGTSSGSTTEHPVGYVSLNIDNALQYLTENQSDYNDLILG